MFDDDINFLPEELQEKEKKERRKLDSPQQKEVEFNKPSKKVESISNELPKVKKTNVLKRIGGFLDKQKQPLTQPKTGTNKQGKEMDLIAPIKPLDAKRVAEPQLTKAAKFENGEIRPDFVVKARANNKKKKKDKKRWGSLLKQRDKETNKEIEKQEIKDNEKIRNQKLEIRGDVGKIEKKKERVEKLEPDYTPMPTPALTDKKEVLPEIAAKRPQELVQPKKPNKSKFRTKIQPGEADVNLMPADIAVETKFKQKLLVLGGGAVLALIIVGLAYFGVQLYVGSFSDDYESVNEQLQEVENQIKTYDEYRLKSEKLSQKIDLTLNLIEKHLLWSKLFTTLEDNTHIEITYNDFAGDDTGQVSLNAVASNFETLAQQLLVLEQSEVIENIEFSAADASLEEELGGVKFNIIIKFKPEVFYSEL